MGCSKALCPVTTWTSKMTQCTIYLQILPSSRICCKKVMLLFACSAVLPLTNTFWMSHEVEPVIVQCSTAWLVKNVLVQGRTAEHAKVASCNIHEKMAGTAGKQCVGLDKLSTTLCCIGSVETTAATPSAQTACHVAGWRC